MLSPTLFPRVIPSQIRDGLELISRTAGSASRAGAVAESEQVGARLCARRGLQLSRRSAGLGEGGLQVFGGNGLGLVECGGQEGVVGEQVELPRQPAGGLEKSLLRAWLEEW